MKVGFIGLGQMGHAIAANLLGEGHELSVWNRSASKADDLIARGAKLAGTPSEAADAEVVFTMLADDAAVEAVTFGEDGILAAGAAPLHVSLSTISPELARRLAAAHAERGAGFVSAPVFGRPNAAAAAKLNIVAAGTAADLATCQPLFDAIGMRTFPIGDQPERANVVKLCGNFMIMAAIESLGEAMTLAAKNGIARAAFLEIMTETLFGAPVYRNYGQTMVDENYRDVGFSAPLGLKDMRLVAGVADASRVSMPVLGVVRDHLLSTIAREGEDIDWSGIAKIVAADAGL